MQGILLKILYSIVLFLSLPFLLIRLFCLSIYNPDYRKRWAERFGYPIPPLVFTGKIIWIHAVSVGEVQASRPLVDLLMQEHHDCKILFTTMTPTGAESVTKYFGTTVMHRYLPYDVPMFMGRFIRIINPSILIVIETELWPNLFCCCKKNDIPILFINARMSEKSAKGYAKFSSVTHTMLDQISLIVAQGKKDAERLIMLGANREKVHITANLKFDIKPSNTVFDQVQTLRKQLLGNRLVWLAASTHAGEEEIMINLYQRIYQRHPACLLIIAPRHPQRSRMIRDMCLVKGLTVLCKSEQQQMDEKTQVFILDSLGELVQYYTIADVAFVGGSFVKIGGHNILEPISLGVPVITGPHVFNFQEVIQYLLDQGVIYKVYSIDELFSCLDSLLQDKDLRHTIGELGKKVIAHNSGNAEKIMQIAKDLLRTYLQ